MAGALEKVATVPTDRRGDNGGRLSNGALRDQGLQCLEGRDMGWDNGLTPGGL